MENHLDSAIILMLLPLVATLGLILNLVLRARGGRSFRLKLVGFGIDLTVETHGTAAKQPLGDEHV